MLLKVEDLPRKENAGTQADRTDGVKCSGKNREALAGKRSRDVKKRNQQQDEAKARVGRKRVPVRRDKQQNSRAQQHPAQANCH